MTTQLSLPLCVAMLAAAIAAVTDVRRFRISNALTIPLLLSGLLYHGLVGENVAVSGIGLLTGSVLLLPLFLVGGMGAGDVKLMAGLGAWLGPVVILNVLLVSCLITGLYSTVLLVLSKAGRSSQRPASCRVEEAAASSDHRARLVPFGVAVAAAVAFALIKPYFHHLV